MFTWIHESDVSTTASAAQVWQAWSHPATWPLWDEGLTSVTLDGPFAGGTSGRLTPKNGPAVRFTIRMAEERLGFDTRSFLPLTHLDFIHRYQPAEGDGNPARIIHRVEMRGALTPLFRRVIGREIARTLPDTLRTLARRAESGAQS